MKYLFQRQDMLRHCFSRARSASRSHKTFIMCPGQSSQYVGMLKKVNINNTKLQEMTTIANKILGYDIVNICEQGPQEILTRTIYCQPAVVVATLLAFEKLKAIVNTSTGTDLKLDGVAGFSVGEIPALHISERLSYEDAIVLLKERASAMDYASSLIPSGMCYLQGLSFEEIRQMCEDVNNEKNNSSHKVSIAIEQFPKAVSLGGSLVMLNKIMNREHAMLRDSCKIKVEMIDVSGAFHTDYMLPAQERVDNILNKLNIECSNVDIYSNVTGQKYHNGFKNGNNPNSDMRELLVRQITEPVLWNSIMEDIKSQGDKCDLKLYEVGPGKVLKAAVIRIDRKLARNTENISL